MGNAAQMEGQGDVGVMRETELSQERVKTTVYLPERLHHRLKILAAQERSSIAKLLLEAVEDLLEERDTKVEINA